MRRSAYTIPDCRQEAGRSFAVAAQGKCRNVFNIDGDIILPCNYS